MILPVGESHNLQLITDEQLEHELSFCLSVIEDLSRSGARSSLTLDYYKMRLQEAEQELERRFLLS
jgi:hypothetical protein